MKSTGIVRKVDELGRIVLPIEMRRTLDIAEKDALEIYVEGENIILRKYQASCIFCDNVKGVIQYRGKNVCPDCINKLKALRTQEIPRRAIGGGFLMSAGKREGAQ